MTQQEFMERTGVQISIDEYWQVNDLYNHCTMNKDEFCKWWCKMNPERVAQAKAERKAIMKRWKVQSIAFEILTILDREFSKAVTWKPAEQYLSKYMKNFLDEQGICYKGEVLIQTVMYRLDMIVKGM